VLEVENENESESEIFYLKLEREVSLCEAELVVEDETGFRMDS
jgi:hypothetical protein